MSERDDIVVTALSGRRPNSRGWVRGNCPFCLLASGKPDRKQCLSLQTQSGKWHCFRCDTRGMLETLPSNFASVQAVPRDDSKPMTLPDEFVPLWCEPGLSSFAARPAYDYLDSRGVTHELVRAARIGACLRGKFAGRVVVPIDRPDGKLAGWVGRAWSKEAQLKYRYASDMNRQGLLYNGRTLQVKTDVPALVVEGVFDTFPFWPDAVAVLGKPDEAQLEALVNARRPVAIVLDGDAWREGQALAMKLRLMGVRAGDVKLPPRVDPDECPEFVRKEAAACVAV